MKKIFFVLLVLTSFSAFADRSLPGLKTKSLAVQKQSNNACDSFNSSVILKELTSSINKANSQKIWEGFDPNKNAIIFVDTSIDAKCISFYDGFFWTFYQLNSKVVLPNTVFDFYPASNANPELKNILANMGIIRALVMSIHDFSDGNSSMFSRGHLSLLRMVFMHEAFHLFAQIDSQTWPAWTSLGEYERKLVVAECYKPNIIKLKKENIILLDSFKSRHDPVKFNALIKEFIAARNERYLAYPECELKEAAWEMNEGIAQYVGLKSSLGKYITDIDAISQLRNGVEFFYSLGALQLFAIDTARNGIFEESNPLLGKETPASQNIFSLLKETFQ